MFTKGEWKVFERLDGTLAHLIAAAPDLYEACKESLELMVSLDIKNKVISGLSLQLHAAIAKADGKCPLDVLNAKHSILSSEACVLAVKESNDKTKVE